MVSVAVMQPLDLGQWLPVALHVIAPVMNSPLIYWDSMRKEGVKR